MWLRKTQNVWGIKGREIQTEQSRTNMIIENTAKWNQIITDEKKW